MPWHSRTNLCRARDSLVTQWGRIDFDGRYDRELLARSLYRQQPKKYRRESA